MSKFKLTPLGRASKSVALWPAFVTALFAIAPGAAAQTDDFTRFGISLGVFFTDRDTTTRLDGEIPDSGTPIDLESDLGLTSSDSVFRIDGFYRFNETHRLDFSAFDLSRSGSRQIDTEIEFDGTVYPVNSLVSANLDLAIYKLAYTWSFLQRENGYLGLTGGLYVADSDVGLSATGIGGVSGGGLTAPLPVIGLRGEYELGQKWTFRGSAEVFAYSYGDFDGSLVDLFASIDYQFSDRIALGLGYNNVGLNLGVDKSGFSGDLDWRYGGALAFVRFDF